MQKDKKLILFTNYYPFYKGEEYIENEIAIAATCFSEILIVPTMVSAEMMQTRKIPENVKALNLKTDCSTKGKIKMGLRMAPRTIKKMKWKSVINEETGLYPHKIIYEIYYFCRVEYVYEKIVNHEAFKKFIEGSKEIVLYSYWMHVVASITARIKDRVFNNSVKCITRGHRYDLYGYAAPCGFVPDREYMFAHMDAIYPCSQDGVDYLKKNFPKYGDKLAVQRLGTSRQEMIECIRKPVFTMVSCAGVRKVKRLDKIIDVISLLINEGSNVKWVHLGDGPEMDKMKKYAKTKLPGSTYLFEGRLSNKEVYEWYRRNPVSCFINLSDSEGVPVAIMEAMSFGIPVVATDVGGTREIVANEINGYVVNKDDSIEVVKSYIQSIYSLEDSDYKKMCKKSYDIWNSRANAAVTYEGFFNLLLD